jgi:fumarylpyruvate hydrolase
VVHRQGFRRGGTDRAAARDQDHRRAQQGCDHAQVNGQLKQKGDLADLIWNVGEIIEHLSAGWTLQPGDLIYTGTPAGVAAVVRGDLMEGEIAGLGTLRVQVA